MARIFSELEGNVRNGWLTVMGGISGGLPRRQPAMSWHSDHLEAKEIMYACVQQHHYRAKRINHMKNGTITTPGGVAGPDSEAVLLKQC
jgi:hypothetical protein